MRLALRVPDASRLAIVGGRTRTDLRDWYGARHNTTILCKCGHQRWPACWRQELAKPIAFMASPIVWWDIRARICSDRIRAGNDCRVLFTGFFLRAERETRNRCGVRYARS